MSSKQFPIAETRRTYSITTKSKLYKRFLYYGMVNKTLVVANTVNLGKYTEKMYHYVQLNYISNQDKEF